MSVLDYSADGKRNIHQMKEYVAKGYALDFGFVVFSSYNDAANKGGVFPYPSEGESFIGGHSMLIVGYDDNRVSKNPRDNNTKTGCFLIRKFVG